MHTGGKESDQGVQNHMPDTQPTNVCTLRSTRDQTRDLLGARLKTLYDDVIQEPVPVPLIELLRRLEKKEVGH